MMSEVIIAIIMRKRITGEEEYLLVSSKKDFGEYTGYYYPPGGHIKPGETKQEAIQRELLEELSVDITALKEVATTPGDVLDQTTYWWLCNIEEVNFVINKRELGDAGFFTRREMEDLNVWPTTREVFNQYIFGI